MLLAAASLLAIAASAHANSVAVYNSHTGDSFNYTLRFTVDQPGETLRAGDFITIYDIPNITSATAPAGFSLGIHATGTTPAGVGPPAITDDPLLNNVTFTYTGAPVSITTDFVNAMVLTDLNTVATAPGKAAATTSFTVQGDQVSTNVTTVPAVPEPASLTLLSVSGVALLVRRRGR